MRGWMALTSTVLVAGCAAPAAEPGSMRVLPAQADAAERGVSGVAPEYLAPFVAEGVSPRWTARIEPG